VLPLTFDGGNSACHADSGHKTEFSKNLRAV
jgi:hypothetical protein